MKTIIALFFTLFASATMADEMRLYSHTVRTISILESLETCANMKGKNIYNCSKELALYGKQVSLTQSFPLLSLLNNINQCKYLSMTNVACTEARKKETLAAIKEHNYFFLKTSTYGYALKLCHTPKGLNLPCAMSLLDQPQNES